MNITVRQVREKPAPATVPGLFRETALNAAELVAIMGRGK